MATRTAAIFLGVGHPNDGGLIDPPGVSSLWLSESSRSIWIEGEGSFSVRNRRWRPRQPSSILIDGLAAILLSATMGGSPNRLPESQRALVASRRVSFRTMDECTYEFLIDRAESLANEFSGKLIIATFAGSAVWDQRDAVSAFNTDIEFLAPIATRLWSVWKQTTQATGFLDAEPPCLGR